MRFAVLAWAGLATASVAVPAVAQTAEPSVDSYLCTFAGKCGGAETTEVTRDAPATKGFRIARASGAPAAAAAPSSPVPARQPAYRQPRASTPAYAAPRPAAFAAARPAPTPGAGRPRADLMIAFELGSDRMTSAGVAKALIFAKSLVRPELSKMRFMIEGHTDSSGQAGANRDLSQRRAAAVANYLVAQGVGRDRLEVKGFGSDEPLSGHRAADPANRRVEAQLIS